MDVAFILDKYFKGKEGVSGTDFGTRDMGQKLREKLLPLINGQEKVVLDFTGVNVVSNSFADECIAKLLLEMPLAELKRRTTFRGLNFPKREQSRRSQRLTGVGRGLIQKL